MDNAILKYSSISGNRNQDKQLKNNMRGVIHATMPSASSNIKKHGNHRSEFYTSGSCPSGVSNPKKDMRSLNAYPKHFVE